MQGRDSYLALDSCPHSSTAPNGPSTHAGRIIIIIFINCNWVITRWQWLFYMYTNMEKKKKKLGNLSREGYMRGM